MTTPINVALVGYGFVGSVFHAPLIAATDGLVLHTVVSSNPTAVAARFPRARVVTELREALADPAIGLVVIATPNVMHAEQSHAVLAARKHLVVDKPFTVTVDEAESVLAHAERAGCVLSVFQNRRYDSDFLTLRALVDDGALGDITQFESHFDRFRPEVRDRWREVSGPGTGLWYDLGPHLLDQAVALFGAPIGITVDLAAQRTRAQTDDYFHATLRYERLRVILHASTLMPAHGLRFSVHGSAGSFVKHGLDSQEEALKAGRMPGDAGWGHDPQPGTLTTVAGDRLATEVIAGVPGDYRGYYAAVRDAIRSGGPNPVPASQAMMVMRLIAMGLTSAATRAECRVPA